MKIEALISLRKYVRLIDLVIPIDPAAFLGKSLYRLDDGIYLQTSRFKSKDLLETPDAPFITGILFAPDDGSAQRITQFSIEDDAGALLSVPDGVFPGKARPEYGSILSQLRHMNPKVCQESASYRIAIDGKFVHRTIETEGYTFYFRGAAHDNEEPPYAVLYKLKDWL